MTFFTLKNFHSYYGDYLLQEAIIWDGPSYETTKTEVPGHSRCDTIEIPLFSNTINADHRPKFAAIHQEG
jgi:hypothetical protein